MISKETNESGLSWANRELDYQLYFIQNTWDHLTYIDSIVSCSLMLYIKQGNVNFMKESEVGDIIELHLKKEGWIIEKNVCGIRGAAGPDIIASRGKNTLCIEVKGHAGNDLIDFKTAIGQVVINMCSTECSKQALACPEEGYSKYVQQCVNWYKREDIRVFLVSSDRTVLDLSEERLVGTAGFEPATDGFLQTTTKAVVDYSPLLYQVELRPVHFVCNSDSNKRITQQSLSCIQF